MYCTGYTDMIRQWIIEEWLKWRRLLPIYVSDCSVSVKIYPGWFFSSLHSVNGKSLHLLLSDIRSIWKEEPFSFWLEGWTSHCHTLVRSAGSNVWLTRLYSILDAFDMRIYFLFCIYDTWVRKYTQSKMNFFLKKCKNKESDYFSDVCQCQRQVIFDCPFTDRHACCNLIIG